MKGSISINFLEKGATKNNFSYCQLFKQNSPYLLDVPYIWDSWRSIISLLICYILAETHTHTYIYDSLLNVKRKCFFSYKLSYKLVQLEVKMLTIALNKLSKRCLYWCDWSSFSFWAGGLALLFWEKPCLEYFGQDRSCCTYLLMLAISNLSILCCLRKLYVSV